MTLEPPVLHIQEKVLTLKMVRLFGYSVLPSLLLHYVCSCELLLEK